MSKENHIEEILIEQLIGLKYIYRPDIVDRKTLEQNFKTKFETLNRVRLSDNEFLESEKKSSNPMYSKHLNCCVKDNTFNEKTEHLCITH